MKILIAGAAGFHFSNFIRKILYNRADIELIGIDKIYNSSQISNIYVNKKHIFYIGDISDKHFVETVFLKEEPDYVINAAQIISNSEDVIKTNILGTQILIEASLKFKIKKFIQISTDKIFEQSTPVESGKKTEEDLIPPSNNLFATTKLSSEMLVKLAGNFGLNYNIIRSCNCFGPRQPINGFIPKVIKNILNEEKTDLYFQGSLVREWIYIDDYCDAVLKILEIGANNEIYHISTGYEITNLELYQKICNIFEKGHNLMNFPKNCCNPNFRNSLNSEKLRKLGWKPDTKFSSGLVECSNWYNANKWFFINN